MQRWIASLAIMLVVAAGFAAEITVFPIDRAQVLVGSHFDFRVEVSGAEGISSVEVLVNGREAAEIFGHDLVMDEEAGAYNLMARGVHFAAPGSYVVSVRVEDASGVSRKSVTIHATTVERVAEPARNVILFISDGMTFNQVSAARTILRGVTEGRVNGHLAVEMADSIGIVTTSSYDSIITDSANSASAYNTGHKTAVNALGVYPGNLEDANNQVAQELLAEIVRRTTDRSIGIITNTQITDATPAAVYAHTRRRAEMQWIADSFLDGQVQPEVFMGGGSRWFIPQAAPGSQRKDERDLIAEAQERGYEFVGTATELLAATAPDDKLLGFFHLADMSSYLDREYFRNSDMLGGFDDQPLLWDMVMKAVEVLSRNEEGFVLIVESGMNDKFLHPLDWHRGTWDVLEMDRAIEMAKAWAAANGNDTLILATADHGHGFSTYGTYDATQGVGVRNAVGVYQLAGFPTYGDRLDRNGFPVPDTDRILAVGINNFPDYCELYVVTDVFLAPAVRLDDGNYAANPVRCEMGGTLMQGNLPLPSSTGVHTLDDVPVYAFGPGADFFRGVMDNTDLFFGIARALQLDPTRSR